MATLSKRPMPQAIVCTLSTTMTCSPKRYGVQGLHGNFNIEFMKDIDFITLVIIYKKKKISSSYFFHQILTYIGVPDSIHNVLVSLEKKDLIKSEGYFDDTSKLIKNISLTMAGEKVLQEDFTKEKRDNIKEYYNNDLLNKILS